jgi:hypothetical protein
MKNKDLKVGSEYLMHPNSYYHARVRVEEIGCEKPNRYSWKPPVKGLVRVRVLAPPDHEAFNFSWIKPHREGSDHVFFPGNVHRTKDMHPDEVVVRPQLLTCEWDEQKIIDQYELRQRLRERHEAAADKAKQQRQNAVDTLKEFGITASDDGRSVQIRPDEAERLTKLLIEHRMDVDAL